MDLSLKLKRLGINTAFDPLILNSIYLFGVLLVGSVFGFIAWTITARYYLPENVGLATSVISVIQLISGLTNLGLGMGVIRFLKNTEKPVIMLNVAFTLTFFLTILVSVIFISGLDIWLPSLVILKNRWDYALFFVAYTIATGLTILIQMVFQACRKSVYAFLQVLLANILRIIFTLLFIPFGAFGIINAIGISTIVGLILGLLLFLPRVIHNYHFRFSWSKSVLGLLMPYSIGIHFSGYLYQIPILLSPIAVLEVMGTKASANTYIGWMIGTMISSPGQALAGSSFAEASFNPIALTRITIKAAKIALLVTLPIAIFFGMSGPSIMNIFGKSYSQGTLDLLIWLAIAAPFLALNKIYISVIQINKGIRRLLGISILSTLIFSVVFYASIHSLGLRSIGLGWLFSQLIICSFFISNLIKVVLRNKKSSWMYEYQ